MAGFFIWKNSCQAEPTLKITKIQFEGESGKADEDFVEFINTTDEQICLGEYKLVKKTSSGKIYNLKSFGKNDFIQAKGKIIWASSKIESFPESIGADFSTKETISKNNGVAIIYKEDESIVDSINWEDDDSEEEEEEEEEETEDYSKIKINEIYPAPNTKKGEEEFIEIINLGEEEINFEKISIRDEKGNKPKISKTEKNGAFYVFYGSFSLNNDSKGDTVFLYDKKDNLIDSQKYNSTKSSHSFAFDGSGWRWTSIPTPGKENVFDKILSGKIIMDEKIYVEVWANFEVKTDEDAKKFTWNFGDGKKSYLKKTRHKYKEKGEYSASLKISGDGEDIVYDFIVKVEKYKAPKIKIIRFSPNPKGKDSENEWIEIENKSKKKINLKGWSIATGSEKLVNHPIKKDFKIKAGKTKKLDRKDCAFTLGNKKTKIELRDPSGKVVQKIKYDRKDNSIQDDEIYEKNEDGWEWIKAQKDTENPLLPLGEGARRADEGTSAEEKLGSNILKEEILANLGKYTISSDWENKKEKQIKLVYFNRKIKTPEIIFVNQPRVLGAKILKIQGNQYLFTKPENEKHWAVELSENSWTKTNSFLNYLILNARL